LPSFAAKAEERSNDVGVSGELTQLNRAAVHVDVTRYLIYRDTIALGAPVLVLFCF